MDDENEEKRLSYGWLQIRPRWLQFLNTPKWFLFFLSQYFFTQSIVVNGIFPGSISTIEKRFGFTSYMSGMLASSYDVAALVVTPLISYLGGSRKKPVFCAWGLFTMGVGFFVFVLPHFISPPYEADANLGLNGTMEAASKASKVCAGNGNYYGDKDDCARESGGNGLYYALFILGMVVMGCGCTPMYALGIPYMDENVKAKVSPMYVGIFAASGIAGAALGFVFISLFLSIFVELGVQTTLTRSDKAWVGNWWLGFLIFGAICIFWSVWLLGFPKEFPLTKKLRERMETKTSKEEEAGFYKLKDLPKATKLVYSNLPFLFITIGTCLESFQISAGGAFMPKVIETQFYLGARNVALIYGLITVPTAFFGNLAGSYINKRLKLNTTHSARMCFIVSLLGFLLTTLMYIKCETPSIPGVNTSYQKSSPGPPQLSSPCNQACNCSGVSYSPVCGGSLTYFSPCHTGCTIASKTQTGSWSYTNCTCLADIGQFPGEVNKGICLVDCRIKFTLFLTLVCATVFLMFLNLTPAMIVTLRSVPKTQESYALGHQMTLMRVLGAIPGPIVYGALIDQTCILWSSKCGKQGYCLEYDHIGLAKVVLGVSLAVRFLTTVCFALSWFFCRRRGEGNSSTDLNDKDCEETRCIYETTI